MYLYEYLNITEIYLLLYDKLTLVPGSTSITGYGKKGYFHT